MKKGSFESSLLTLSINRKMDLTDPAARQEVRETLELQEELKKEREKQDKERRKEKTQMELQKYVACCSFFFRSPIW